VKRVVSPSHCFLSFKTMLHVGTASAVPLCRTKGILLGVTFTFLISFCVNSIAYEHGMRGSASYSSDLPHHMGNFKNLSAETTARNISKGQPLGAKCNLCSRKWLFVVGTGRSGSTTLMNMIDVIPSYRIAGENSGAAAALFALHEAAETTNRHNNFSRRKKRDRAAPSPSLTAWYQFSKVELGSRLCAMQAYALTMLGESGENGSNEVIGWKEIRYSKAELDFMRLLFPCAKFVVNIRRDTKAQTQSSFQKRTTFQMWDRVNSMLLGWSKRQPRGTVHVFALEDFSLPNFDRLLRFLGEERCRYRSVIHVHGNGSYTGVKDMSTVIRCSNEKKNPRKCHTLALVIYVRDGWSSVILMCDFLSPHFIVGFLSP